MASRVSRPISRLKRGEHLSTNPTQGLDRSSLEDRIASTMPLLRESLQNAPKISGLGRGCASTFQDHEIGRPEGSQARRSTLLHGSPAFSKPLSCTLSDRAQKTDLLFQKSINREDEWLFVDASLLDCSSVASDFEAVYSNFINLALVAESRQTHNFSPVSLLLGFSIISYYLAISQHSTSFEKAAKVNDRYGVESSLLLWARSTLRLVSATLIQVPMGIIQGIAKAIGSKATSLSTLVLVLKDIVAFAAILGGLLQIVSSGMEMIERRQFVDDLEKAMASCDKRKGLASGLSFLLNQVDLTDKERDRIKSTIEEDGEVEIVKIEEGDEKFLTMIDKDYIEKAVCKVGEKKEIVEQHLKRAFILERKRKINAFERVAGTDALKLIFEELNKPSERRLCTRLFDQEDNLSVSERAHSLIDQVRKSVCLRMNFDLLKILTSVMGIVALCLSLVGSGGILAIVILVMFTASSVLSIVLDGYTLSRDYKEKKVGTRDVVMFVAFSLFTVVSGILGIFLSGTLAPLIISCVLASSGGLYALYHYFGFSHGRVRKEKANEGKISRVSKKALGHLPAKGRGRKKRKGQDSFKFALVI